MHVIWEYWNLHQILFVFLYLLFIGFSASLLMARLPAVTS